MHIHLDVTGGIAGDMFSAAMLDTFPHLQAPLLDLVNSLELQDKVAVTLSKAEDKGLNGHHFNVALCEEEHGHHHHHDHSHDHSHHHSHDHGHHHTHGHHHSHDHGEHSHGGHGHHHHNDWQSIRRYLRNSSLEQNVKQTAIGIFSLLAEAEAKVHNMPIESVQFHEVGAWDCIVDIISASWLICHSKAISWSVSSLPWGGGEVNCAHGNIPVPAPATLNLLKGFAFHDDGVKGERITPTGAAILSWLAPKPEMAGGVFSAVGYGFGTKRFSNRANVLRICALDKSEPHACEQVAALQCDIDDMTGEMLANAREYLRTVDGVLEITESVSHGKKNRMISTLTLLTKPESVQAVCTEILNHTSTLGVRHWLCDRVSLPRLQYQVEHESKLYATKTVQRPDGSVTSKIEADHLEHASQNYQQKTQLKRDVEQQAEATFHEH